eukprot:1286789-Pyramimonas_sp.AAC.2
MRSLASARESATESSTWSALTMIANHALRIWSGLTSRNSLRNGNSESASAWKSGARAAFAKPSPTARPAARLMAPSSPTPLATPASTAA